MFYGSFARSSLDQTEALIHLTGSGISGMLYVCFCRDFYGLWKFSENTEVNKHPWIFTLFNLSSKLQSLVLHQRVLKMSRHLNTEWFLFECALAHWSKAKTHRRCMKKIWCEQFVLKCILCPSGGEVSSLYRLAVCGCICFNTKNQNWAPVTKM